MKNKFLLIMFMMMIGVMSTSMAVNVSFIENEIVDKACIMDPSGSNKITWRNIENEIKIEGDCDKCHKKIYLTTKAISSINTLVERVNKIDKHLDASGNICGGVVDYHRKLLETFPTTQNGYYIANNLLEGNAGKRIMVVVEDINNHDTENIRGLITFDKDEIDLYQEVEYGEIVANYPTKKYGISPVFSDVSVPEGTILGDRLDPTAINLIAKAGLGKAQKFFVCSDHMKCKECDKFVASAGNGNIDGGKYLNMYCAQDHVCGFFWDVMYGEVGYPNLSEGLECFPTEAPNGKREGTSQFCKDHKCLSCDKAIIGVNMVDGRYSNMSIYQSSERSYYSDYCFDHFCTYYSCRDAKVATNDSLNNVDKDGNVVAIANRCSKHTDMCSIDGCKNKVRKATYDEVGRYLCDSHSSLKKDDVDANNTVECKGCRARIMESDVTKDKKGNIFCQACVEKIVKEGKIEYPNADNSMGQTTKEELDVKNVSKIEVYEKCAGCGKYKKGTTEVKGVKVCADCIKEIGSGNKEVKGSDGQVITKEDVENVVKPENIPTDIGYTNPGYGSNSDTAATPSVTECVHANYPVPNTVRFTDITQTTHVQEWECVNCKGEQKATYEHTYINRVCVCGHLQDSEKPNLELISPENVDSVKAQSEVRIRLTDNVALKSIKYKRFWGTDMSAVNEELKGGALEEILIGNLPKETGKYTFLVQELVDAAGNKLEDQTFIFEVKESDEEKEKPTSSDVKKPKISLGLGKEIDNEIKDNTTLRVKLKGTKLGLLLSDNNKLGKIVYSCLWEEDPSFKEKVLSGGMDNLVIKNIPKDEEAVLVISELEDKAGNKLEKVIVVFEVEETQEADTVKPKVELMSPQNLSEVKGGANIKFKFSDNEKLDDVKYTVIMRENALLSAEIKKEKEHSFNGALSQDLDIATIENNASIVIIDLKLRDVAGNESNAKYTFNMSKEGFVDVKGEGEAGFFVDDREQTTEKNLVEYEDDTVPEPIG